MQDMRPDLHPQEWLGCLTRQKGREKRVKREEMVFARLEIGYCNIGMLGQQERVHPEWVVCVGGHRSGGNESGGRTVVSALS